MSGLGNKDRFFKQRKCRKLFHVTDDITLSLGIAEQTDNFRMILVADNNGCIPFLCMFADDRLHLDNMRAGRIDYCKAGVL